jgi:seryl-tRNA synthetase
MGFWKKSKDDWMRKAAEKNEKLVKISQDIAFYQEKTNILSKNIILLQKKPEENEARIHEEAESLIDHNKKLTSLYADMIEILKDIEKIDKKLVKFNDVPN